MTTIGRICISGALSNKLGLMPQPFIQVRVANIIVTSKLKIQNSRRSTYMLSPKLSKALYIKKSKRLQIRYDQAENMLHLGPTIGVLSSSLPNRYEFDPRGVQAELIYLSNVGKTLHGQIFIFTPKSINWANKTCRGYNYHQITPERGRWVSSIYPLPDVVYDRIPSRRSEARENIKNTKNKLRNLPYLKYFNPSFLNKWKVYEILINNSEIQNYLPETRQLTTENLDKMLQKYKTLYLKPSNGSLGRGIIKVRCDDQGILHYVVYGRSRHKCRVDSAEELMKKTRVYRRNKSYIVQQGIKLETYKGSSFDIRIIYQKNSKGEWQIGKKFVRVAARGSSISNLSRGGRVERSKKVFSNLYRRKSLIERKNDEIARLCKIVATTLENISRATYGELGLDIGMDKTGKPWLIEVNSKPRKTTETEFSKGIVKNSFKRPLQYSMYLAGF